MDLPLRLEFDLTAGMVRDIDRALISAGSYDRAFVAARSKLIRTQLLLAPVWFLAGLGGWRLVEPLLNPQDSGGLALGAILATIVPTFKILSAWQIESARYRALGHFEKSPGRGLACTGRISVELTERCLVYMDPWTRAEYAWPLVISFVHAHEYVLLTTLSRRMIIIPCGCLPSDVSASELIETAKRLHEQAGGPDEVILHHLQEASYKCPGCGYDLRGVKNLLCPECARVFGVDDLDEF